ncbi:MAG: hypothetical protein P8Y54_10260 [Xanthomonadales bacterium]
MANAHPAARPAAKTTRKQAILRTSISPVEDLESYVKADWWRDIFKAEYLRTPPFSTCAAGRAAAFSNSRGGTAEPPLAARRRE